MTKETSTQGSPKKPETGSRVAKVIARAGLCSRREAETWVTAGRVTVNGKIIRTPAFNVTESDKIVVDGNPLAARAGTRVWLYHKPVGLVVTEKDPEGRDTIFEALEKHGLPRVLTIGRLDINTEGLLMLTNDGGLKRILELPDTGWLRRYRVRAHGRVTQEQLDKLKDGMEVDGVKYGSIDAELERVQGGNVWINIALREGKNREIKNVLGALGLEVNRLIRTSYGPFQLGDIPVGAVSVVRARVLRDQLGRKLAKQAGVDFDSPLPDDAPGELLAKNPNQRLRKRDDATLGRAPKPRGRTGEPKPKTEGPKPRKNAPERRGNFAPYQRPEKEEKQVEKRVVHFSDGRPSTEFEPKAKRKRDDDGEKRGFSKGRRDAQEERPRRANGDGPRPPRREGDSRPPRREGESRPLRRDGESGARGRSSGDRKFDDKPRGDRKFSDRPKRDYGDRPRGPRPDRDDKDARPRRAYPPRGDGAARRAMEQEREARFGGKLQETRSPASQSRPSRSPASQSRPSQSRPSQSRTSQSRTSLARGDKPRSGPPRSGPPRGGKPRGGPSKGPAGGRPAGRGRK